MKVLQLIDSLEAGGAERMAVQIANGLAERSIPSFLVATRKEGALKESIQSDVDYSFLNRKSTLDFSAVIRLNSFIKENGITIIHAHSSSFFIAVLMKLIQPKVKIVWHDHFGNSEFLNYRSIRPLKLASKFFNKIIVVNEALRIWVEERLKIDNISVLYNYAEFENYSKTTLLKGKTGKRIVCLANLRPQKDHFNLIDAFEMLYQDFPDWSLHLVGKDFEDAYSVELKKRIEGLNAHHNIFVYGTCQDIENILNQASIGVLASKSEGLPLSLLEYGLAGLPVVATDTGDCKEVIKANETGVLVQPMDSNALFEGLHDLVGDDFKKKEYGKKLKKHVALHFGKESFLNKLVNIYATL